MPEHIRIIDAVVTNLDRLSVQGVRNMALIIDSLNALNALREALSKEEKPNVPPDAK